MMKSRLQLAIEDWDYNVYELARQLDPNDEIIWNDMAIGFALAKGFSIIEAKKFPVKLMVRGLL